MQNKITRILMLTFVLISFSSCELVEGIFKAGIGVGVFIVVAVIAVIVFLVSKVTRRR